MRPEHPQTPPQPPVGKAIGDIISHLGRLMALEVAVAKKDAKSALTAAVMAAVFGFVAVLIVLVALILMGMAVASGLIALGLVPWAAQALTAFVFIAVAGFLLWLAKRRISHAMGLPGRILARLTADMQTLARAAAGGEKDENRPDE